MPGPPPQTQIRPREYRNKKRAPGIDHRARLELGRRPKPIWRMLGRADDKLGQIETMYLEQDFQNALTLINDVLSDLEEADKAALHLKNQTLFWVYPTQWLTITGTSMATGV